MDVDASKEVSDIKKDICVDLDAFRPYSTVSLTRTVQIHRPYGATYPSLDTIRIERVPLSMDVEAWRTMRQLSLFSFGGLLKYNNQLISSGTFGDIPGDGWVDFVNLIRYELWSYSLVEELGLRPMVESLLNCYRNWRSQPDVINNTKQLSIILERKKEDKM